MSSKPLVAVIGQGVAGCTAAHFLAASSSPQVRVHLLGEELAGKATTVFDGTAPIDTAATLVTDTYTLVNQLADSLGLAGDRQPLHPLIELRDDRGGTGSFTLNDPGSLLFYSLLNFEDKLRLTVELVHLIMETTGHGYDPMALASMPPLDTGLTAADYVQKKMGAQVLNNMARALEGLWLTPLEQMSEAHLKAWFSRPTVHYSVFGQGVQRIWSTLVDRLRSNPEHQVTSGVTVTQVARSGAGYELTIQDKAGHTEREQVDAVVLALNSPQVLTVAGPLLSSAQSGILDAQKWVPSIHGVFQVRARQEIPASHGFVAPCGPATHPVASVLMLHHHRLSGAKGPQGARPGETDLASIYASGALSAELEGKSDAEVYRALYEAAQRELGSSCLWLEGPSERDVFLFRRPYGIPTPAPGSARTYLSLEESQRGQRLQLAGGWTQLPVPYSMESSARSGQKSAERLLQAL